MAIENVEPFDPADLENKVLIIRSGARYIDAKVVIKELRKVFPQLEPHRILIIPDDLQLCSMTRQEAITMLRANLAMLGGL